MLKLLRKVNFYHFFWFFLYFFIFCLLLHNSFSYLDPDWGWHLQVGQEIAQTKSVPSLNYYNYTFTGNWVDHEWLSNFLIYTVYTNFGYVAISIIFSLLVIIVLALLNFSARRLYPESFWLLVLLQIFGVLAISPHLGVRIQEVGLIFLLPLLFIIDIYNKQRKWQILLFLLPLMYLWACLHASFLIGFFLLGAWLAVKIGERILNYLWPKPWLDLVNPISCRESLIFTGISILSFGVTLLTPYKLQLYTFLKGYQNTFYLSRLQEWLSQFSFPLQYLQLLYLAVVTLALILYVYYALAPEKYFKINLWKLFLVVLFVGLSFKSRRHFPLMFVATFLFTIEVYSTLLKTAATSTSQRRLNAWLGGYLLLCLFLVGLLELVRTDFTANPLESYCGIYPCGAAAYLASHPELDSLNIFNEYSWGGYLIWRLPGRKLFIDGRLPQVEFAGQTFLEEYLDFFKEQSMIKEKLDKYQIRMILLPAEDKKISFKYWEKIFFAIKDEELDTKNHLRDYLLSATEWRTVYYDKTAVIYVR